MEVTTASSPAWPVNRILVVVGERYTDEEALANHGKSDQFKQIGREMGAFMDGRPEIMRMQQVE